MSAEETPSLDELRRAFQETTGARAAPCPSAETIWEAVHGELPAAAIRQVVEHLAACPACALEWRLARELGGRSTAEAPVAPAAATPAALWRWPRRRHLLSLATAASVLVAAAVGILQRRPNLPAPVRGHAAASAPLPLVTRTVRRTDPVLEWVPDVPGTVYSVNVTTEDGAPVGRAEELAVPRYRLPAANLAPLPAQTRLLATLTVARPGGSPSRQTDKVTLD